MAHGYLGDGFGEHGEIEPGGRDDRDRRRDDDRRGRDRAAMFGERGRFSANPDDHYRNWRDRHMAELDRDYEDYCRECERDFHRGFDEWRRQKYGNPQPLRTGMTQTGLSHDPSGMSQAAEDRAPDAAREPDPTADATLGTNSGGGPRSRNRS
jgi:hypothetical protein